GGAGGVAGRQKTIVAIWSSRRREGPAYAGLCSAGVPLFHSFCGAVRGIKALVDWSAFVDSYVSPFDSVPVRASRAAAPARKLLAGGGARNEVEAKELLRLYGIRTVDEIVATSAREAVAAASSLGFPVVMKILSADIAHKSDRGLVVTGVQSAAAVRKAFGPLVGRAGGDARIDGVVVQRMIEDVVAEAILGLA